MNNKILDDSFHRLDTEHVVAQNKSGDKTVDGKSLKQRMYDYKRKYGDAEYKKLLEMIEDGIDDEKVADK